MTLQSSGTISLLDVQNEFGGANPIAMSEYYRGGSYVPANYYFKGQAYPVNETVPTSGQIALSNFYGTSDI